MRGVIRQSYGERNELANKIFGYAAGCRHFEILFARKRLKRGMEEPIAALPWGGEVDCKNDSDTERHGKNCQGGANRLTRQRLNHPAAEKCQAGSHVCSS